MSSSVNILYTIAPSQSGGAKVDTAVYGGDNRSLCRTALGTSLWWARVVTGQCA